MRFLAPVLSLTLALHLSQINQSLFVEVEILLAFSIVGSAFLSGGLRQSIIKKQKIVAGNNTDMICFASFTVVCGIVDLMLHSVVFIFFLLSITRAYFTIASAYFLSENKKISSILFSSWFPVLTIAAAIIMEYWGITLPKFAENVANFSMFFCSCVSVFFLCLKCKVRTIDANYLSIKISMTLKFLSKRVDVFLLVPYLNDYSVGYLLVKRFITIFDMFFDVAQTQVEKMISEVTIDEKLHAAVLRTYRKNAFIGLPIFLVLWGFNVSIDIHLLYLTMCLLAIEPILVFLFGPLGLYANYNGFASFRFKILFLQFVAKCFGFVFYATLQWSLILVFLVVIDIFSALWMKKKFVFYGSKI